MNSYLSVTGVITQIQPMASNQASDFGCTLLFTIHTGSQGEVQFTVNGNTYVIDNIPFNTGDRITLFYDGSAPAPLIYPPRYQAVVAAPANYYQYYLGEFYNTLISTDGTLQINNDAPINAFLPNGQIFSGALAGKTVLVEYSSSSRSIPAIISPNRIIVFCFQ